jgi:hypothetical protein
LKKAREGNGERAVPRKYYLDLAEALRSDSDLAAVPQKDDAAEFFADKISDVVADDAADPGKEQQQRKRHVAVLGHYRAKDQQGFPRQGRAERLKGDDNRDSDKPVLPNQRIHKFKQMLDFVHERRSLSREIVAVELFAGAPGGGQSTSSERPGASSSQGPLASSPEMTAWKAPSFAALPRVPRDFPISTPGNLGIAGGDDLHKRFVVIDRATTEHSRPPNARTFACCIFDLGADDTEAMALERRVELGQRNLRCWCLQSHVNSSRSP